MPQRSISSTRKVLEWSWFASNVLVLWGMISINQDLIYASKQAVEWQGILSSESLWNQRGTFSLEPKRILRLARMRQLDTTVANVVSLVVPFGWLSRSPKCLPSVTIMISAPPMCSLYSSVSAPSTRTCVCITSGASTYRHVRWPSDDFSPERSTRQTGKDTISYAMLCWSAKMVACKDIANLFVDWRWVCRSKKSLVL